MPDAPPALVVPTAGGPGYPVHFGPLALAPRLAREAGVRSLRALVVTDGHVGPLHAPALLEALRADGWQAETLTVPPGEASKSAATLAGLYDRALALGVDRGTAVFALGGGVVGDLAGFFAATLLRGLPLVHLPTTTIAQVDSAIGGKTGINHAAGKNLIGAFYPPALVLADVQTLQTLPVREFRSGLAEMTKHALLAGGPFLDAVERGWDAVLARDPETLRVLLREAANVKARIVGRDEREGGERAFLNLGHTFGHAAEKAAGYGALAHGEAVALGLRAALHLSAALAGALAPSAGAASEASLLPEPWGRMDRLVARLPVPRAEGLSPPTLLAAMGADKKRDARGLRFVVLDGPARPRLASDVPEALVLEACAYALEASEAGAAQAEPSPEPFAEPVPSTGTVTVTEKSSPP